MLVDKFHRLNYKTTFPNFPKPPVPKFPLKEIEMMSRRKSVQTKSTRTIRPACEELESRMAPAAGFTITPAASLVTSEAARAAQFQVKLKQAPTAAVTIGLVSSDLTEGNANVGSLVFTSANWNVPQAVTVTGVDDFVDDGDILYKILLQPAQSADPAYNGLNPADVSLTNRDNDTAGLIVTPKVGLTINEGSTGVVSVALKTQPTRNVRITVVSERTSDATVSPRVLTFTPANWNVAQTFSIVAVNRDVGEPTLEALRINLTATGDAKFAGLKSVVNVRIRDLGKAAFNGVYAGNLTATGQIPLLNQSGTISKDLVIQFTNGRIQVIQPTTGEVKPVAGSETFTLNANGTASLSFKVTATQSGVTATIQVNATGRKLGDGSIVFQGSCKSLTPAVINITSSSFIVTRAPV